MSTTDPLAAAASTATKISEAAGSPSASADIMRGVAATAGQSLLADLSPPAQVLVSALDAGLGIAAGFGVPVSEVAGEALVSLASSISLEVGNVVAEIAGDIASAIPVVGPIIKALVVIVQIFINAFGKPDDGAECQRLFQLFQPKPTGSNGTMPCDIFARNHGVEWWYAEPYDEKDAAEYRKELKAFWSYGVPNTFIPFGSTKVRSALGMALMQITEGTIFDVREIDKLAHAHVKRIQDRADDRDKPKLATAKQVRALWGQALDRDARLAPKQWAHRNPGLALAAKLDQWVEDHPEAVAQPKPEIEKPGTAKKKPKAKKVQHAKPMPGLPATWRDRFRRLRRAIEASGTGSDGGVHLWIIYQDLLVAAFDRGYLNKEYVEFLFARQNEFARAYKSLDTSSEHWVRRHVTEPLLVLVDDQTIIESSMNAALLGGEPTNTAAPPTWIWRYSPCPEMVTANVMALVDKWRRNIHPKYAQDQAKIAALLAARDQLPELIEQAREVGRATGGRQRPLTPSPAPAPLQTGGTEEPPPDSQTSGGGAGVAVGLVMLLGFAVALAQRPRRVVMPPAQPWRSRIPKGS